LIFPVFASLLAGALLIFIAGGDPFHTYVNLFSTGFSCQSGHGRCALLTTLQFATPLIFSGLSAAVALRAGFFSIGQMGQMLFGAAGAAWVGSQMALPAGIHPLAALLASALLGAQWGLLAALLREYLKVNEIISTLLMNTIAGVMVGLFRMGKVAPTAQLTGLVPGSKVTAAFFGGLVIALAVYIFLWRTRAGYEIRMQAQASRFSQYGGIRNHRPILVAMSLSGALAGLAGAVEVLGVQYNFVTTFSAISDFDGLIVAFAGHLHPLGVVIFSILLGGLRHGSLTGLQMLSNIPRELGGALIALMLIFVATNRLYRQNGKHTTLH